MTVDIVMATYNGGKFLRNQLLSLQQQTFKDWILWVRDDGSSDSTIQIIDEFSQTDKRVRKVEEGSGQRLGPACNFLGLMKYARSDYLICCDQDDIWFEKKLELLVAFATENFDKTLPCLVYSDAYGYSDQEGVITINGVSKYHARTLSQFLFFNSGYQGCSILFNQTLAARLIGYKADYYYMHDDIISLLGHVFGQVHFLPKKLMLYRQHVSNVTGNISSGMWGRIRRILCARGYVLSKRHFEEKKSFFEAYAGELSRQQKELFIAYLAYPHKGIAGRLWLVLRHGFSVGQHKGALVAKTILCRPMQ